MDDNAMSVMPETHDMDRRVDYILGDHMADTPPNGWEAWGKHVLLELQRLSDEVKSVHIALDRVRSDMTQIAQEESLNTDFRVAFCESWRKYRVAIVGALATAAAGIIVQLVLAGMGG